MKKKVTKEQSTALIPVITRSLPAPTVVPKLTKSQVIKAMVELARRKHDKSQKEYTAREDAIKEEIESAAWALVVDRPTDFKAKLGQPSKEHSPKGYKAPSDVTLSIEVTSPVIRTLLKKWFDNEDTDPGYFNSCSHEEKIKSALDNTDDKINLILAQPENVETIEKLLAKIFTKDTVID